MSRFGGEPPFDRAPAPVTVSALIIRVESEKAGDLCIEHTCVRVADVFQALANGVPIEQIIWRYPTVDVSALDMLYEVWIMARILQ